MTRKNLDPRLRMSGMTEGKSTQNLGAIKKGRPALYRVSAHTAKPRPKNQFSGRGEQYIDVIISLDVVNRFIIG